VKFPVGSGIFRRGRGDRRWWLRQTSRADESALQGRKSQARGLENPIDVPAGLKVSVRDGALVTLGETLQHWREPAPQPRRTSDGTDAVAALLKEVLS
jgi:hypothetical protein